MHYHSFCDYSIGISVPWLNSQCFEEFLRNLEESKNQRLVSLLDNSANKFDSGLKICTCKISAGLQPKLCHRRNRRQRLSFDELFNF